MNALLLLGSGIAVAGLLLAALLSVATGSKLRAALLSAGACAWVSAYGAGVLAVSLLSNEVVLPPGATKRFCGFYLDCHVGVAVREHSTTPVIGGRRAGGVYHIVTLELSSNAVRATLKPARLRIQLVGAGGTRYARDMEAEAALTGRHAGPLEQDIPAGGAYTVSVVFDLPAGAATPRLFVGEGVRVERLIETVLIGDEDSFLHKKTMLSLPRAQSGTRTDSRQAGGLSPG